MAKNKDSGILEAVHETAKGLSKTGLIDKRRMQQYDALCLSPAPDYSPEDVKGLRKRYNLSQAVFADVLNTSASTVRQWESGSKHPRGTSLRLLDIIDRKGIEGVA